MFSIRGMIPGLLGGRNATAPSGHEGGTVVGKAMVSDGVLSTYLVPADFPEHTADWFDASTTRYPPSADNEIETFVDGKQAYPAMKEAMETATGTGHFIVLVGWTIHIDFDILAASDSYAQSRAERPPAPGTTTAPIESASDRTLDAIVRRKAAAGVIVRTLIWSQPFARQNDPSNAPGLLGTALQLLVPPGEGDASQHAANTWASLSPGVVFRADPSNYNSLGSHHQKILLVSGTEGLIGFYGGVDFNPDRITNQPEGAPQHDIHARVRGPAAQNLWDLVQTRWQHSYPAQGTEHGVPVVRSLDDLPAVAPLPATREPRTRVQIGHTVGNPHIEQQGWTSNTLTMIRRAIGRAQRFVYLEDQYLWSEDAMRALAAAVSRLYHVTILLPGDRFQMLMQPLRLWALRILLTETPQDHRHKIGVYERIGTRGAYVHAKAWIFDDELAIIGSANCNRRGYQSDSEVIGVSSDLDWSDAAGRRAGDWHHLELDTAHSLRMRMWAKHLVLPEEDVYDGVGSAYLWRRTEPQAEVTEYMVVDVRGNRVPWRSAAQNAQDPATMWLALSRQIDPPHP